VKKKSPIGANIERWERSEKWNSNQKTQHHNVTLFALKNRYIKTKQKESGNRSIMKRQRGPTCTGVARKCMTKKQG